MDYNYKELKNKGAIMVKRIFSAILLCAMLLCVMLSAVSCGEASKVNSAVEKTRELSDLSADLYLDLDVTAGHRAKHYKVVKEITSVLQSNGERLSAEYSQSYEDGATGEYTYIDGKYAYLPSGEKQEIGEYGAYNTVYTDLVYNLLVNMPKGLFEEDKNGYEMAKTEEYASKMTIKVDFNNATVSEMDMFRGMYSGLLDSIIQRAYIYVDCEVCQERKTNCPACAVTALDCEACKVERDLCQRCVVENFEVEDCRIELELKDGYVSKALVEFDAYMDLGENGDDVAVCGKMELHINNPGEAVTVALPEGADKWELFAYTRRPILRDLLK